MINHVISNGGNYYLVATTHDVAIFDLETHKHVTDLDTLRKKVLTLATLDDMLALGCDMRRVFIY